MTNKRASLSTFRANDHARPEKPAKRKLIDKHFRVTPEAARAFNLLAAQQYSGEGPRPGPALVAEALNLLFEKYGMEEVA